jgi:hypothetical protein
MNDPDKIVGCRGDNVLVARRGMAGTNAGDTKWSPKRWEIAEFCLTRSRNSNADWPPRFVHMQCQVEG